MNAVTLKRIVVFGTLTGMRSMAGLAMLTLRHPGAARPVMALAAVGEIIADKTPLVGDRVDALPLAGRAIIGALVGALIARESGYWAARTMLRRVFGKKVPGALDLRD